MEFGSSSFGLDMILTVALASCHSGEACFGRQSCQNPTVESRFVGEDSSNSPSPWANDPQRNASLRSWTHLQEEQSIAKPILNIACNLRCVIAGCPHGRSMFKWKPLPLMPKRSLCGEKSQAVGLCIVTYSIAAVELLFDYKAVGLCHY